MNTSKLLMHALAAAGLLATALPALAHIEYYDLNQGKQIGDLTAAGKAVAGNDIPLSNPAYWSATYQSVTSSSETWTSLGGSYASGTWGYQLKVVNMDSAGWTDGLRTNPTGGAYLLGDSHKVNWANFHLSQASIVSITVTDPNGYGLNPSLSLYRGSAVYQAHDDASVDPLNPRGGPPTFAKIQNAKDTGSVVDSQGITSAYRNTLTNSGSYFGQFNALGDFSVSNSAGNWSAVDYVASATGTVNPDGTWAGNSNSNSLLNLSLGAGDYIIGFSGNAAPVSYASLRSSDTSSPFGTPTNMEAVLTFSAVAAPVPEPESWALMLVGMALIGGVARRRSRQRV